VAAYSRGRATCWRWLIRVFNLRSETMKDSKQAAQGSAATAKKLKYRDMTGRQKAVFITKLVLSILSFGFLYPNLMGD
jgi:hypothetical protein